MQDDPDAPDPVLIAFLVGAGVVLLGIIVGAVAGFWTIGTGL